MIQLPGYFPSFLTIHRHALHPCQGPHSLHLDDIHAGAAAPSLQIIAAAGRVALISGFPALPSKG